MAALTLALLMLSSVASAQSDGFRIDRLRPPPTGEDGLGVQYARTLGHLVPSAGLVIDYAHDPLIARTTSGELGEIVSHRVLAHVTGAIGVLDFLEFHLRVPVAFSAGDGPTVGGIHFDSPDVVSIGDGAIGGTASFFSEGRRGFSVGLGVEALIPWGTSTSYASDTAFSGRAQLLATYALRQVTISIMVGALYRPERNINVSRAGSELEYAASILIPATLDFDVFIEAVGAVSLPEGQAHPAPLEAMLGARYRVGSGVALETGVGVGFSQAPGVPDVRAILGVRWTQPPPPIADTDGDGLLDPVDQCPEQAEDRDGWQDTDGCIDPDDDADGWMDEDDACPREPEDRDGFRDTDGCPDHDDDGDGLNDDVDRCPRAPGETFQHGCPQLITVSADRITFTWPIEFAEGSPDVPPSALGALNEIARTLFIDDAASRWRIAVRAVPIGRRDDGMALALARAQSIVAGLVTHDIAAMRFEASALPAGPGDPIEMTNLGPTVHHAPPPPRPAAPEAPPAVVP